MHWRRKWQPTPVLLPGESQGQGILVGCRPWGRTESDTTEVTWQQPTLCSVVCISQSPTLYCPHFVSPLVCSLSVNASFMLYSLICCIFKVAHISNCHTVFGFPCLISLSTMPSKSIHDVVTTIISSNIFSFLLKNLFILAVLGLHCCTSFV